MEEKKTKNTFEKSLDKTLDFFLSKDIRKWLVLILLLGIFLRFLTLKNLSPLPDEMVHATHAIDIIKSGVINSQNQSIVWFYLTDIAYRLLGISLLTSRFLSFIFCSLTVVVLYLITKRILDKKTALIASFLLAVNSFHIRFNHASMDGAMVFFVLFGFYLFIKKLKDEKKLSYLSVLLFGISILIKPIFVVYVPALAIYFLLFLLKQEKEIRIENIKRLLFSTLTFLLFTMPVLAYNYILYVQKGITDVLFSRFFNVSREVYSSLQGFDESFNISYVLPTFLKISKMLFFEYSTLTFSFAIIGLLLIFTNKKYSKARFFFIFHAFPLFFLLGAATHPIHHVSFVPILCVSASVGIILIATIIQKSLNNIKRDKIIIFILAIILIINLFNLSTYMLSASAIGKMRAYSNLEIEPNDIIVADARIYRGTIAWMFNDKAYLEASHFSDLMNLNQNSTGNFKNTNVYFIECVTDDCGWGTVGLQPALNQSMEKIVELFKTNAQIEKRIIAGGGDRRGAETYKGEYFKIHKTTININQNLFPLIYQTHEWFYYPVRYWHNNFYDSYSPEGLFQTILHSLGKLFLWIAVILALLSPILLLRILIKDK